MEESSAETDHRRGPRDARGRRARMSFEMIRDDSHMVVSGKR
jgi:hypothetical protein